MIPLPKPLRAGLLAGALAAHGWGAWAEGSLPPGIHGHLFAGASGDALPGTLVQVVRDRDGILWTAGDFGLYRLAGRRFLRVEPSQGLPEGRVTGLVAPREGGLWVITPAEAYFLKDGRFQSATRMGIGQTYGNATLPLPGVGLLVMEPNRSLWIRGRHPQTLPPLPSPTALAAWSDSNELLVATQHTLYRLEEGTWTSTPFNGGITRALFRDRAGTLWIRTTTGLLNDAGTPFRFRPLPESLPPCNQATFRQDAKGRLWTNSLRGIHWLENGHWHHLGEDQGLPEIGTEFPFHLDPDGQLWVGGNGLLHFPDITGRVNYTRRHGLPSHVTWSLTRDRAGVLWAATSNGLARMDAAGFKDIPLTRGRVLLTTLADGQGGILAGGYPLSEGLALDHVDARGVARRLPVSGLESPTTVSALAFDPGGDLWMGSLDGGCYRLVREGAGYRALPDEPQHPIGPCFSFSRGSDDALWVCFGAGLGRRTAEGWKLMTPADGLLARSVISTVETRPGERWVAYEQVRGLTRLTRDAQGLWRVAEHLGPNHPMAQDLVVGLGATHDGLLIAATGRGLKVRWPDGRMRRFGREEGFLGEDCIQGALFLGDRERWWIGTQGGLVALDRSEVQPSRLPAAVRLLSADSGKGVSLPLQGPAQLRPGDSSLTYRFHAIGEEGGTDHVYQIRLAGEAEGWRTQAGEEANLTSLSWGHHRFEVRVMDWEGRPGPVTAHEVYVLRPWYASWWTLGLGALSLGGLFRLYLTLRTRTLRRRAAELEDLVHLRTVELEEMYQALLASSVTDPLTGLRNRKDMGEILKEEAAQVARVFRTCHHRGEDPVGREEDLILFLVDLDHFKRINDTLGHPVGDEVLKEAAHRLVQATRESDLRVRWGGEEFLLVARRADRRHAAVIARNLLEAMRAEPITLEDGQALKVTASVGFAAYPLVPGDPDGLSMEETLALADRALYAAKRGGRNAWVGLLEGGSAEICREFLAHREERAGLHLVSSLDGPLSWTGPTV